MADRISQLVGNTWYWLTIDPNGVVTNYEPMTPEDIDAAARSSTPNNDLGTTSSTNWENTPKPSWWDDDQSVTWDMVKNSLDFRQDPPGALRGWMNYFQRLQQRKQGDTSGRPFFYGDPVEEITTTDVKTGTMLFGLDQRSKAEEQAALLNKERLPNQTGMFSLRLTPLGLIELYYDPDAPDDADVDAPMSYHEATTLADNLNKIHPEREYTIQYVQGSNNLWTVIDTPPLTDAQKIQRIRLDQLTSGLFDTREEAVLYATQGMGLSGDQYTVVPDFISGKHKLVSPDEPEARKTGTIYGSFESAQRMAPGGHRVIARMLADGRTVYGYERIPDTEKPVREKVQSFDRLILRTFQEQGATAALAIDAFRDRVNRQDISMIEALTIASRFTTDAEDFKELVSILRSPQYGDDFAIAANQAAAALQASTGFGPSPGQQGFPLPGGGAQTAALYAATPPPSPFATPVDMTPEQQASFSKGLQEKADFAVSGIYSEAFERYRQEQGGNITPASRNTAEWRSFLESRYPDLADEAQKARATTLAEGGGDLGQPAALSGMTPEEALIARFPNMAPGTFTNKDRAWANLPEGTSVTVKDIGDGRFSMTKTDAKGDTSEIGSLSRESLFAESQKMKRKTTTTSTTKTPNGGRSRNDKLLDFFTGAIGDKNPDQVAKKTRFSA